MKKLYKKYIRALLPKRPVDANKGTFGKVLVIAGSKNYPGAAYLACAACYRVGAGLVTLATEDTVKIIVSKKLTEVTFLSFDEVFEKMSSYDVLLVGPGLGQSDHAVNLVKQLIKKDLPKTVIDGDGLNILSKIDGWYEKLKGEIVLTPHPGEMSRLTNLSIDEVQKNREDIAKHLARKWNKVVVLKGANTIIVSPAGVVFISPFANPALSTAGTGDILSGIITGYMAQGLDGFEAAGCGVYVHGLVGEWIKDEWGDAGVIASDLLPLLPKVIKYIKENG